MHSAICDECGKECQVPFKPTGEKPVYCSDCFERQPRQDSKRRDFPRRDFRDKEMYSAVCDKCGNQCEIPFKPTTGKPIFCKNCFESTDRRGVEKSQDNSQIQQQINDINLKLDNILKALETLNSQKEQPKTKIKTKKTTEKKSVTKKPALKKAEKVS